MARINSNISSVIAQANFGRTQKELALRLERLSTGLRINRGKDDPAGLIISERLRTTIQGVDQGIKNSDRANSVISTTEASLTEVNDLLNSIKSLIVEAANSGASSDAERNANQLQIDSAIESITRISNTASFGGLKLLNGALDYKVSGMNATAISQGRINNASFVNSTSLQVQVDVIASAQRGSLYYQTNAAATTPSALTLEVRGAEGVEVITIASGQTMAQIAASINNLTALTGVRARVLQGVNNTVSGVVFESAGYGSNEFVSVKRLGGPADPAQNGWTTYAVDQNANVNWTVPPWGNAALVTADSDNGRDVSALINGNLATGNGLEISINSGALGMNLLLNETFATTPIVNGTDPNPTTFYITGGGAQFQLGPEVNALQQTNIGIQSVAASALGGTLINGELAFLSSLKRGQGNDILSSFTRRDFTAASSVLESAIDEISKLRGRLGAFTRNVLETNTRSLQASFENLSASDSQIRDADFAAETSKLTRAQILSSSGISTLSLANQQSQNVLQLLG
jgi:flagellin